MQTDQEFSSVVQLPQFPGRSVVTRSNAPEDPHQATALTIERMKDWAARDANSAQVVKATAQALMLSGPEQEARSVAIHQWISSHCKFREDDPVLRIVLGLEDELEMLITPARLLSMSCPAGDCDCLTTLCMSMHLCAGIPIEPVTIKADPNEPERDSHVYCQAILDNGTLILDPAMGCKHKWPPGAEAPEYFDKQTWGAVQPERYNRKGLQGYGLGTADEDLIGIPGVDGQPGTVFDPTAGAGFNWGPIIGILAKGGLDIAKMQSTPVGYVQRPDGSFANYGAGGQIPLNLGGSLGLSSNTLLLGGAALLAVLLFSRGR